MFAEILRPACALRRDRYVSEMMPSSLDVSYISLGLNYIVEAYCSLLRGISLQPLKSRPDVIRMKKRAASVSPMSITETHGAYLAHSQISSSRVGWGPAFDMILWNAFVPPKRSSTCCVPSAERLLKVARKSGKIVTAHDLVMAHIWKVSMRHLSLF